MCLPLACCCPPGHRVSVGLPPGHRVAAGLPYGRAVYVPNAYPTVVPSYVPTVAPAPLFGGRVGRPFVGATTYRGPVVTPSSNQQAPGLGGRATMGPVGGRAPHVQVGTRR